LKKYLLLTSMLFGVAWYSVIFEFDWKNKGLVFSIESETHWR